MKIKAMLKRGQRFIRPEGRSLLKSVGASELTPEKASQVRNASGDESSDVGLVREAIGAGAYTIVKGGADFFIMELNFGRTPILAGVKIKAGEQTLFLVLGIHVIAPGCRDHVIAALSYLAEKNQEFSSKALREA